MVRIQRCVPPQMWIHGVRAIAFISEKFVIIAIADEPPFFVGDETINSFSDKAFANPIKVGWVKFTIRCVAIMHLRMSCGWFRTLSCHMATLVFPHETPKGGLLPLLR